MEKNLKNKMMNIASKMMLSCERATFYVDKSQYEPLSCIEKFSLNMHLATCKFCRLYKVESNFITTQIKSINFITTTTKNLTQEEKKIIKQMLDKQANTK